MYSIKVAEKTRESYKILRSITPFIQHACKKMSVSELRRLHARSQRSRDNGWQGQSNFLHVNYRWAIKPTHSGKSPTPSRHFAQMG